MTALLTALVMVAIPCLMVSGFLALAERAESRRALARDRQIALTDAIHWELGAVAAPTVSRLGRGWRVAMAVPLDRPAVVAAILRVTACHFSAERAAERLEIVLVPDAAAARPVTVRSRSSRPAATDRPLAA